MQAILILLIIMLFQMFYMAIPFLKVERVLSEGNNNNNNNNNNNKQFLECITLYCLYACKISKLYMYM